MKLAALALLLTFLAAMPAGAQTKPIVAVFDLETGNLQLSKQVKNAMAEFLSTEVASTGVYQVVPRDQVRKRLLEQKKESFKQCYDGGCQIEIGKELAAQKSMSSKVMRIGKKCVVTLTIFDLRQSATERAVTVKGNCSEEGILESIEKAVAGISAPMRGTNAVAKKEKGKPAPPIPKLAGPVLAAGTDFRLYKKVPGKKAWVGRGNRSCCVNGISAGPDGTLYGVGNDQKVWRWVKKGNSGEWAGPIKNSCCVKDIAFDSQGVMIGVGQHNRLYRKQSKNVESIWKGPIDNSCCVYAIAFDRRILLGLGTQNQIWRKESTALDSKWIGPIPNSCCVKSLAFDSDGRLLGVSTQNEIWKKETTDLKSRWLGPLPNSCCVFDLTPLP